MKKNKDGFIMIITIVLIFLISIILFIWSNIILKNTTYLNLTEKQYLNSEKSKNKAWILFKYDDFVNNNWLWEDELSCSWGLIEKNLNWFSCLWSWVSWSDWIDDECDNDDKTPYYYNTNVDIDTFTTIWSDLVDDDADVRIYNIWFLYPEEEKTIFFYNNEVKNKIISDLNNQYFEKPTSWNFYNLELTINWLNSWEIKSIFIEKDKNFDDIINYQSTINSNLKTILNINWEFLSWVPYPLNLWNDNKIYFLNLYNDSDNIVSYNLIIKNSYWNLVYQIPIDYGEKNRFYKSYEVEFNKDKLDFYIKNFFKD